MRHCVATLISLGLIVCLSAAGEEKKKDDTAALVKKLAEGSAAERDDAEQALRKLGADAIPALRDGKTDNEEGLSRVRNTLTDLVLESSKMTAESAALVHSVAREEGKGKRYNNAERLYQRAEQLYDQLKDDADRRKDRVKEQEYAEKQRVCDRMKDKAGHKLKGQSGRGVDIGFVRIGTKHDLSDDWE
jgi:hypothetical protein